MTNKRKASDGDKQVTLKRFKKTPSAGGGQGNTSSQSTKSKAPASIGKKTIKALKWKKKKRYVFSNAKPASNGDDITKDMTFKKKLDDVDGTIIGSDDKGVDRRKSKKRRKKKKKLNPTDAQNSQMNESSEQNTENKNELTMVTDSSQKPGTKAWKQKKRKGKIGKEGKQGDAKSMLPRKPDEVSANWKAMLSTLQKDSPSKTQERKTFDRKGKGTKKGSEEIWFDVDPELLKANEASSSVTKATKTTSEATSTSFVSDVAEDGPTKCVALDCEMVGIGREGKADLLARVSIVNQYGHCLYDKFVKPREDVTDYRTWVSGVRADDVENGEEFLTVQKDVADLLKGRVLVGHALQNDFKVLFLDHPKKMVRDTSRYEPFRQMFRSRRPGLKGLVEKILKVTFQQGEHDSVEDAQAVMKLYMLHRKEWEKSLKKRPNISLKKKGKS